MQDTNNNSNNIVMVDGIAYKRIQVKYIANTTKKLSEYIDDLELDIDQYKLQLQHKNQVIEELYLKIKALQKINITVQTTFDSPLSAQIKSLTHKLEITDLRYLKLKGKHEIQIQTNKQLNQKIASQKTNIKDLQHYHGAYTALCKYLNTAGISQQSILKIIWQESNNVIQHNSLVNTTALLNTEAQIKNLQSKIETLQKQITHNNNTKQELKALKHIIRQYNIKDQVIKDVTAKFQNIIEPNENFLAININYTAEAKAEIQLLLAELNKANEQLQKETELNADYETLASYSSKLLSKNEDLEKTIKQLIVDLETLKSESKMHLLQSDYKKLKDHFAEEQLKHLADKNRVSILQKEIQDMKESIFRAPTLNKQTLEYITELTTKIAEQEVTILALNQQNKAQ